MSCLKFSECCRKKMSPVGNKCLENRLLSKPLHWKGILLVQLIQPAAGDTLPFCSVLRFACDFEFVSLQVNEI